MTNDLLAAVVQAHIRQLQARELDSEDACSTQAPPLSADELRAVEQRLGFPLPASVKEVYGEIANGGFGPAYGLLKLHGGPKQEDGNDALTQYELYRRRDADDHSWRWPAGLVPLVELGCAMFFCVDCTTPVGAMVWFEPNGHTPGDSWDQAFVPLRMTFEELMRAWAGGTSDVAIMEAAWNDAERSDR